MNLVFIYGPPATGKLTVAKELEKLTDYRLFHNHLTVDLALEVLPDFDERLFELTRKLRLDVFEAAAKYDHNLIFTYVYTGDETEVEFVQKTIEIVKSYSGSVYFVQLTAPLDTILARVSDESRKKYKKIADSAKLKEQLEKYDMNVSVDVENVLIIDTSKFSPIESAKKIVNELGV